MHTRRWLLKSALLLAIFPGILARNAFAQEIQRVLPARERPTLIFLLAGQSNMVGQGEVSLLPEVFKSLPANVAIWDRNAWRPMKVQGTTFGPEVTFAHAVASALPHERIGVVKVAKGGSAIGEWAPKNKQSYYGELMRQYRAASRAAPNARPAAMLWMQGERDSREAVTAAAYAQNLKELVAVTRENVGDDKLAFLCGLVNPPIQIYAHVNAVRAALTELPNQIQNVAVVSSDELEKKPDNLHYDVTGQLKLGLRFAKAYLKVKKLSRNEAGTDPFARGEIWAGSRTFAPPTRLMPEPLWLIVTNRDDMNFKGEAIFLRKGPKTDIYKVEGTATSRSDGVVSFSTEKKGFFQLSFQGRLNKGQLDLSYSGSGIEEGSQMSGEAHLKP